jgi:hypothetical protein
MKKLKSTKLKFSSSERQMIKDVIRTSLRTDTSVQTVFKGPIRFVKQDEFNLTVDSPKARRKVIKALKKAVGPMRLVVRFRGPVVIGVKRMSRSKKVLNPITGRYINRDGTLCKRMLKDGFTIVNGILKPPKDYMRKDKKNASLIILNREIERIRQKNIPGKEEIIKKLEETKSDMTRLKPPPPQLKNTGAPNNSMFKPPPPQLKNTGAPNNSMFKPPPPQLKNTKAPPPSQLKNTGAPNNSMFKPPPPQLKNTKAPPPSQLKNTRAPNNSMFKPPPPQLKNTKVPMAPPRPRPAWRKVVNFVNPFYKKPALPEPKINNTAKRLNNATVAVINKMEKEGK